MSVIHEKSQECSATFCAQTLSKIPIGRSLAALTRAQREEGSATTSQLKCQPIITSKAAQPTVFPLPQVLKGSPYLQSKRHVA